MTPSHLGVSGPLLPWERRAHGPRPSSVLLPLSLLMVILFSSIIGGGSQPGVSLRRRQEVEVWGRCRSRGPEVDPTGLLCPSRLLVLKVPYGGEEETDQSDGRRPPPAQAAQGGASPTFSSLH